MQVSTSNHMENENSAEKWSSKIGNYYHCFNIVLVFDFQCIYIYKI